MIRILPSQHYLSEIFEYHNDGYFINKTTRSRNSIGSIAGYNNGGYRRLNLDNKSYYLHVLIWVYHKGDIPQGMVVDHILGIKDGGTNRIENLQLLTGHENTTKQTKRSTNKSGYIGVTFVKKTKKWLASIRLDGRTKHLGYYFNIVDAAKAYDLAVINQRGKLATTNFPLDESVS